MAAWVVFGDGGHSRSVVDALVRRGDTVVCVASPDGGLDDDAALERARAERVPAIVAIGRADVRRRLVDRLVAAGVDLPPMVAATATVAPDAVLGPGTVVLEHAHVGPAARLGRAVIVNTGAVVEHDCVLGDGVHVGPRATLAGHVRCGTDAQLGAGAVAIPFAEVGAGATVGAGAVVLGVVPAGRVVVGVPARTVGTGR